MTAINKLYAEIIEIEQQMAEKVKELPKWNNNVGIYYNDKDEEHTCKIKMYAFQTLWDITSREPHKNSDKVICLKCGGYAVLW